MKGRCSRYTALQLRGAQCGHLRQSSSPCIMFYKKRRTRRALRRPSNASRLLIATFSAVVFIRGEQLNSGMRETATPIAVAVKNLGFVVSLLYDYSTLCIGMKFTAHRWICNSVFKVFNQFHCGDTQQKFALCWSTDVVSVQMLPSSGIYWNTFKCALSV